MVRALARGFLLVILVHQSSGISFEPTEEQVKGLRKYQNLVSAVTTLVRPSALKKDGEVLTLPEDREDQLVTESMFNDCTLDLFRLLTGLNETWALKMLDADAKPPSGVMDLNLNWMGDYYECQNVVAPPASNRSGFSGRYCTFKWSITVKNITAGISTGLCVPSSCSVDELKNLTNILQIIKRSSLKDLLPLLVEVTDITCRIENSFDAAAFGTLFVLGVFILLMAAGTLITIAEKWYHFSRGERSIESVGVYTILENSKEETGSVQHIPSTEESGLVKFLKCFCVLTNGSKLLATDARGGDLRCVHGIRFLSMSWVILGHTYAFAIMVSLSGNMKELLEDIDTLPFQAVMQGTFSVDSFFVLSGFLLTYLFLKEATKNDGKIPWGFFYIHRYWRLTPVYAVVLAFNTALTAYLADGPNWFNGSADPNCRKSWWWNLLYINNFQDSGNSCMAWSWYLANDMQFYVISPIFLYLLYRWPKVGLSLVSGLILSSWIATGVISHHYDFFAGYTTIAQVTNFDEFQSKMGAYFEKLYIKPYTRIGTYLIGVVLGYAVHQQLLHKKPLSRVVKLVGWVLSIAGGLGIVFGFYHNHLNALEAEIYNSLNRSVFAASLAWVIFACLSGCGGPVNAILSWNFLVPLSRLTYCAYLVHPIILTSYYASLRRPIQATHSVMVTHFLGFLVMSYVTAFFCSLAFESSLMALEKLALSKFGKSARKS